MENTIENKAKFFSNYYLQNVYCWHDDNLPLDLLDNSKLNLMYSENDIISLRKIKDIKDNEFIELAQIFGKANIGCVFQRRNDVIEFIGIEYFKLYFNGLIFYTNDPYEDLDSLLLLEGYDYLRGKGFALPYKGLSIEEQLEYGWIKLT